MKRTLAITILGIFSFTLVFGAATKVNKGPIRQDARYTAKIEPNNQVFKSHNQPTSPVVFPAQRDEFTVSLVDSSKNGYGMILGATRPLEVDNGNFFFVYRQWAGAQETSGQIGSAYSSDGENWTTYNNVNNNLGIGRYPSALGSSDYPFAIWNEYTGEGPSDYGGHPYYSYDEFGWDGESMSDPQEVDLAWSGAKDRWVASPDHSYDATNGLDRFNVSYADWTSDDKYLYHSEAYEEGFIVFGSEIKVIDVQNDMVGGTEEGSFASTPILDVNDDGIGYVAVSTYFDGGDQGTSEYANHHTMAFKMTEDYGATWSGNQNGSGYYYIPDNVLEDVITSGLFPDSAYFPCSDTTYFFEGVFVTYDFDLRVDSEGNPHFVLGLIATITDGVYPGIVPENGFYHFWIDKDNLDSPGTPNTATGWNYSFIASTQESWSWNAASGNSYWQITFPSFAISSENDNVMWVVSSMVNQGTPDIDDNGTPADSCDDTYSYPEWSEDVYVFRSTDGGVTWDDQINVTNTPDPDPTDDDSPEEINAHAAEYATNDTVYVCYQMPDWLYGSTTGDPDGPDHKNRVYAGWYQLDYVGTDSRISSIPENYRLEQAYPNPFNPSTTIEYEVKQAGDVQIAIYDILGHQVTTLVSGYHEPNTYQVEWNGINREGKAVPSGMYLYRMTADNFSTVKKVMLLK